ncbi:putative amino acid transporter, transmembrane domain-containing protein [Plasmopara halstedii]
MRATSPHIVGRRESEPGFSDLTTPKALDIAVPGGFRRHHLQTTPRPMVSKALRDQIIKRINSVYDPFIGNILSQDNDEYDEMNVEERAQSLLLTPLPAHHRSPSKAFEPASERTELIPPSTFPPKSNDRDKTTTLWHALLTFRSGGILFSPLCLTFVAALTLFAMLRLLQCRELVGGTYGHVGFQAYGSWGRRMVTNSIILMQAGFCCTYVIFVAQNMAEVLIFLGYRVNASFLILVQFAVYIPFFTFEGIGLVLPTQNSLNQARQKRFPGLLSWTVVGLLFFYSFFAGINYVTFGNNIAPMVTSSLPRNGWSSSVQFGYAFAQLLSYPLFLFPAVKIMEEMLDFQNALQAKKWRKTFCDRLDLFVSIVGAFCCVPLSLVYPPLFYLKLNPNPSWFDKIVDPLSS